jgi:hypothetical protein
VRVVEVVRLQRLGVVAALGRRVAGEDGVRLLDVDVGPHVRRERRLVVASKQAASVRGD